MSAWKTSDGVGLAYCPNFQSMDDTQITQFRIGYRACDSQTRGHDPYEATQISSKEILFWDLDLKMALPISEGLSSSSTILKPQAVGPCF